MKRTRTKYGAKRKRLRRAAWFWATVIVVLIAAVCRVRGSQEFYLTAGDTMVIPCLEELWSDQSFSCVIGNSDVIMLDGSGRAVIALGEGTSEVFVHLTNPEMDVQYTFIVTEPVVYYEVPAETEWPEMREWSEDLDHRNTEGDHNEVSGDSAATSFGRTSGTGNQGRSEVSGHDDEEDGFGSGAEGDSESGQGARRSGAEGGSESGQGTRRNDMPDNSTPHPAAESIVEEPLDNERWDSDSSGTDQDPVLPEQTPVPSEPASPFWENTAGGGVSFEQVAAEDSRGAEEENDFVPLVRIISDGETRPVFVSVGGREVSFKYAGGILYVRSRQLGTGAVRGGVLDCRDRMYYFSLFEKEPESLPKDN